jgi:hypothetical protein
MTPSEVHFAIQKMTDETSVYGKAFTVDAIAQSLHINNDELLENINILQDLYYVDFIGHKKEELRLTYSGIKTIVPQ